MKKPFIPLERPCRVLIILNLTFKKKYRKLFFKPTVSSFALGTERHTRRPADLLVTVHHRTASAAAAAAAAGWGHPQAPGIGRQPDPHARGRHHLQLLWPEGKR